MTRVEYLNQMQSYREELHNECKLNREALVKLEVNHKENVRKENEEYERMVREQRDKHTEAQHDIERKMNALKVQWAQEHPINETRIVE